MGADNLKGFDTWKKYEYILDTYNLIIDRGAATISSVANGSDKPQRKRGSRRNNIKVSAVVLLVYCKICNILSHFMWSAICVVIFTVTLRYRVFYFILKGNFLCKNLC